MVSEKARQAFDKALREAQAECGYTVPHDKKNPHFNSRYASLPSVLERVMPAAAKHGLTLSQRTEIEGDWVVLISVLSHDEGYEVTSKWPVARVTEKPQALGSALTYAKRYQTTALFGLAADEDDDGNAAQKGREEPAPKKAVGNVANSKPAPTKGENGVGKLLMAFGKIGVKADELEQYLGHPLDSVTAAEMDELRGVYGELTTGASWEEILDHKAAERARGAA